MSYYSCRLQKDQLCYYYRSINFLVNIDNSFLENYQSIYLLCFNCEISDHKVYTQGKKKLLGVRLF